MAIHSRYPIGTNIYDHEWDAVLILDTCRVDALREVAPEYRFLDQDNISSIWSVGSSSSEWIAQTFTRNRLDEIQGTAYISGNGWAEKVIAERQTPEDHGDIWPKLGSWDVAFPEDFHTLEQAWKYEPENRYDLSPGHPHPRYVTDRVIDIMRHNRPNRLIAHYSQPHEPWTAAARKENRDTLYEYEEDPWTYLQRTNDKETVWNAYLDDLRLVLDHVELVLKNIDASRVIITADHGEGFGEGGVYGHGIGVPHPQVKRVPWAVTSATDQETHEPSLEPSKEATRSAEEQLEALGYV